MLHDLPIPKAQTSNYSDTGHQENRRQFERIAVDDLAELVIDINGTQKACRIHNLSKTGAMIESTIDNLPRRLVLVSPTQNLRILCRVVWHCRQLAGIEFVNKRIEIDF